jgi:S-adenosylmethionine/arginine decarboxylase-like enzyme
MMRPTSVSYQRDPFDDLRPAARRKRTDPDAAVGIEWMVDAFDCTPEACRSLGTLGRIVEELVDLLDLPPVQPPIWQTFDGGGVTGMLLLSEGHIVCQSFPESRFAAFNVFCSHQRPDWNWDDQLAEHLGAGRVVVRELIRG